MVLTNPILTPFPYPTSPLGGGSPLTYRESITVLGLIERLKDWIQGTVAPELHDAVAKAIEEFTAGLTNAENTIIANKREWQALFDNFMEFVEERLEALSDEAMGDLLELPTSQTAIGLNKFIGNLVVKVADTYGELDKTGLVSSHATLQAALNDLKSGETLLIKPGKYLIETTLTAVDKSVNIVGDGVELVYTGTNTALTVIGGMETIYNVSSILPATVVVDDISIPVLNVSTNAATNYDRGEVVKIFADDVIPGSRPVVSGSAARVGQFATVHSSSGNVVTLLISALIDPMTSNVRIARMKNLTASISGLTITIPNTNVTDSNARAIGLQELINPRVENVTVAKIGSSGISLTSCYGYLVENFTIGYNNNSAANQKYGYAVSDIASSFGVVRNLKARHVRHAYTDGTPAVLSVSAPVNYGRSYGAQINGIAHSTTGASFDTHNCSQEASFLDCVSYDSGTIAFSLRGRRGTIRGRAIRPEIGVYVASENAMDGDSWGHNIDVFVDTPRGAAVSFFLRKLSNNREVRESYISNLVVVGAPSRAIALTNATVKFGSVKMSFVGNLSAETQLIYANRSIATFDNLDIDLTGTTVGGATHSVIGMVSNPVEVRSHVTKIEFGSLAKAQLFNTIATGQDNLEILKLSNLTVDYWPAAKDVANFSVISPSSWVDYKITQDTGDSSALVFFTPADFASMVSKLRASLQPHKTVAGTQSTAFTFPVILNGRYVGQRLTIMNFAGGGTINVVAVGRNIQTSSGSNVLLNLNDSINLMWTGTIWRQI